MLLLLVVSAVVDVLANCPLRTVLGPFYENLSSIHKQLRNFSDNCQESGVAEIENPRLFAG